MEKIDISQLEEERPNLYMELQLRNVREAYRLNCEDTGPDSLRARKKYWIIYAKGNNDYIILSTKGNPDKFYTWLHYGEQMPLFGAEDDSKLFITIDKAKLGRKPRELTEQEKAEILARREKGETINQIAKAMHLGTRRIMGVINA